jgi:hypothetical protein
MASTLKPNRKGIRALLKHPDVLADLERRARAVAARAGGGHIVDSGMQKNRARAAVITQTAAARRAEAEERNLTRAIDAARGDR